MVANKYRDKILGIISSIKPFLLQWDVQIAAPLVLGFLIWNSPPFYAHIDYTHI